MNDDGSNQHPVLNVAKVPAMESISGPSVFPNGGTSIAFVGRTYANLFPDALSAEAYGLNWQGIYTFANGSVSRISAEPMQCHTGSVGCASYSIRPRWTADGEIAYEYGTYGWLLECSNPLLPCAYYKAHAEAHVDTVAPTAGAGIGTTWQRQFEEGRPAPAPNPADAGQLLYIGPDEKCPGGCQQLFLSTGNGTDTSIGEDDFFAEAAWNPEGTRIADVEGGASRGIWTYGPEPATGKSFVWALEDPIQNGSTKPSEVTFSGVSWIGNSKIVFSAEHDLWTIPASCGEAGAPTSPCQFPKDARRLTSDGVSSSPSWTSSTAALTPPAPPASVKASTPATKPSALPAPTPPIVAPVISNLTESASKWREGNSLARLSGSTKPPTGTTFTFGLNVTAKIDLTFIQAKPGRVIHKRCVAETKANRKKKKCRLGAIAGKLTFSGHAGTNHIAFQGRLTSNNKLAPAYYGVVIRASVPGAPSSTKPLYFTIVR